MTNFKELVTHHDEICESLFHTIVNDNNHRLYKLLPAPHESTYSLRSARPFNMPRFKTLINFKLQAISGYKIFCYIRYYWSGLLMGLIIQLALL